MRISIASVLSAAALSHALVGDWTSYTHLQVTRDLEGSKGNVFVATTGGIRKLDPKGSEKVYRNTEGLRDVGVSALAASPEEDVYATSDLGYIYRYRQGEDDWEILTTSYRSAGWKMNKRALLYRSGYLVLGGEKGLSFFNVRTKIADANVTKMGFASGLSVNSVLFVGDTLFAGTSQGIFKAFLDLNKLLTNPQINIYNPGIWTLVPGTDHQLFFDPASPKDDTAYYNDSLRDIAAISADNAASVDAALYSHGLLYYGSAGIASEYEGMAWPEKNARVSAYGKVLIDGKAVADSPRLEVLMYYRGKWYTGNAFGMYQFFPEFGGFGSLRSPEDIPEQGVTAMRANRFGVFAFATPYAYSLGKDKIWQRVPDLSVLNSPDDTRRRGQHAFDVSGPGQFSFGTWGSGFQTFRNGVYKKFDATNSCLVSTVESDANFPVIWSQTPYKDKGIWMVDWLNLRGYHFGYYDFSTETITCFEPKSSGLEPRNLQVVGDSVLVVVTESAVEAYRIRDNGASVTVDPENLLSRLSGSGEATLAGKADRFGNFWVTTEGSHLLYVPSVAFNSSVAQSYRTLDGFTGSSCMNLESDPQGHLWAGCTEGGIYEIIPGKDTLSHTFRQYGLNDGLVSETIFHLDVDEGNGDIWVATEKGMARYESRSRPTRANLSSVKVYPNPFLARHSQVVFDNLASGSEVQVTTQSGSVVYHRSLASGAGDQIRWDGRNQAGERVREGVYFWIVRSPKETKNGKIIVAR